MQNLMPGITKAILHTHNDARRIINAGASMNLAAMIE